MPRIELHIDIAAPIQRVFDLSRSIDFHVNSQSMYLEQAIAGRTTGLIELGETVTWRAKHFGFMQTLTSKITAYERPTFFQDQMVKGAFKSFTHDHIYESTTEGTRMTDVFTFSSPLGPLGMIANKLAVTNHMHMLLEGRAQLIKAACEGNDWKKYLP